MVRVRAMMTKGFNGAGFEVATAASVTEALRTHCDREFDVPHHGPATPDPGDGFIGSLRDAPFPTGTH